MEAIRKSLIKHLQKWKDDECLKKWKDNEDFVKLIDNLKAVDPGDLEAIVDLVFKEATIDCISAELIVDFVLPSIMRSCPEFRDMFVRMSLDKFQKDYIADLAEKERGGSQVIKLATSLIFEPGPGLTPIPRPLYLDLAELFHPLLNLETPLIDRFSGSRDPEPSLSFGHCLLSFMSVKF